MMKALTRDQLHAVLVQFRVSALPAGLGPNPAPQVLLEHYLKQLKLPTMLREYVKLAEQCAKEGVDFQRFLLRLVEAEMLERDRRATERRIKAAKFSVVKSLETFDYLAIPSLNKKMVLELARCEWIGRRENVLCLGNSGTGKTHIGLALGLAACQRGLRVRFTTAAALVHELLETRDENSAHLGPERDGRPREPATVRMARLDHGGGYDRGGGGYVRG
jgi:DNA replication protein DnaC